MRTDSLMLTEITNLLPALKQQAKYMLTAMFIKTTSHRGSYCWTFVRR